jgi:hypothetical protein
MKKLVILLITIALGVMFLWSPLSARDRDPTKPVPWMQNYKNPSGDDDPFSVDKTPSFRGVYWWTNISERIFVLLIVNTSPNKIVYENSSKDVGAYQKPSGREEVPGSNN